MVNSKLEECIYNNEHSVSSDISEISINTDDTVINSINRDTDDIQDCGDIININCVMLWHKLLEEIINMSKYIDFLNINSSDLEELKHTKKDIIIKRCTEFYSYFEKDENFNLFIKKKTKLFSHKNTISNKYSYILLDEKISLRDLLTNQSNKIKDIIWKYLYKIYLSIETFNNENINTSRIESLEKKINTTDTADENTNNNIIESVDNGNTDIISDIISQFGNSMGDNNNDLMKSITAISQNIGDKYGKDIMDNKIDLDSILKNVLSKSSNVSSMVPDLFKNMGSQEEEAQPDYVIDENFSTASVKKKDTDNTSNNMNIGNMLKMVNNLSSTINNFK